MSDANNETIVILTGEAMWPDRVNKRWPGAQFVARARFDSGAVTKPDVFAAVDVPATWGILIRLPNGDMPGSLVETTTDRGETIDAIFDPAELLAGDPEMAIAAARYWELPWRYVAGLRDAAAVHGIETPDEEPRDDAISQPAN